MTTVSHIVSTAVTTSNAGRDWLGLLVQATSGVGAVIVAGMALLLADRQNKRTIAISRRQVATDERKLQAELYDRRFAAWNEAWAASDEIYKAILNRRQTGEVSPAMWVAYDAATSKIFFLFSRSVLESAQELRQSLERMNLAKVAMENPTPPVTQNTAMGIFMEALQRCEGAKKDFRFKTREEIAIVEAKA